MNYKTGLKSNIRKFFLFEILISLAFFYPIFNLFYLARGLSITQIAFLGVIWVVTNMALEIPSGIIADKWGRKKSLSLFVFLFMSHSLVLVFAHNYILFLVASAFHAAAFAFYSGTNVAFFYDTLVGLRREKEYVKLWGKINFVIMIPSLTAMFLGGFLFSINEILPYAFTAFFLFMGLLLSFTFQEPKVHKSAHIYSVLDHFKESFKTIISKEKFIIIVLTGAVLGFSIDYIYSYGQIYLKDIGLAASMFGILYAVISLITSFGYIFAEKVKNTFEFRKIILSFLIITGLCLFLLSRLNTLYAIGILIIPFFIRANYKLLQRGFMHKHISSHNRATVDSMANFSIALIAVIAEPILGKIADIFSIQKSFFIISIIIMIYTLYFLITKFHKKRLFR
ncbi:MFS transporter [Candidatus Pacearchaeota archaeon]|nr:MFS transporter [Candidatus Pacearchaeota archaeon]